MDHEEFQALLVLRLVKLEPLGVPEQRDHWVRLGVQACRAMMLEQQEQADLGVQPARWVEREAPGREEGLELLAHQELTVSQEAQASRGASGVLASVVVPECQEQLVQPDRLDRSARLDYLVTLENLDLLAYQAVLVNPGQRVNLVTKDPRECRVTMGPLAQPEQLVQLGILVKWVLLG